MASNLKEKQLFKINNPWLVCLVGASFFFYQYIQIIMFNVLQPDLVQRFNTDPATLALVASLYFYGTVALLIPAGMILDHVSTRKLLVSSMAISVVGLVIFFNTDSIAIAAIGRFITGISGGAFSFVGTLRLCNRWFPENKMAFITGLVVSIGMLGSIVALAPFTLLVDALGLETALNINIAIGIFITVIMFLFIHDYPTNKKDDYLKQIAYNQKQGYAKAFKQAVSKPQNWLIGLATSLLNIPMLILGALWGVSYLVDVFALSNLQASITCSGIFVGMIFGAPLFGVVSDRIKLRKLPFMIGLSICLAATLVLLLVDSLSYYQLIVVFLLIGFGLSSQCVGYPLSTEINPVAIAGSVLGVVSTLVMAGGAVFQPLVGWLIESNQSYTYGMWVLPACILVSALCLSMIKETHCRRA